MKREQRLRLAAYKKAKEYYLNDGPHRIYGCGLCYAMSWATVNSDDAYYFLYSWKKISSNERSIESDFPELYKQGLPKHDWHDDSIGSVNERLNMLDKAIEMIMNHYNQNK